MLKTYRPIRQEDGSYLVEAVGQNRNHDSLACPTRFKTEQEAQAWIDNQASLLAGR